MASTGSSSFPKVLTLYLELSQYPILAPRMRQLMREKLFERSVINPQDFEAEVREKARQSQRREGVDSIGDEPHQDLEQRLTIIRDNLTDFYFAYNLPHSLFEEIVREVLADRMPSQDVVLTFHPELAPWDMLFSQGEAYEKLPPQERDRYEHDLQEIKVVLIKSMISDHLEYLGIAKDWFDIATLKAIRERRIGRGKIGGKSAGIKLAETVLRKSASQNLLRHVETPASWYIGADVFYQFTQLNDLLEYTNQKYKSREEIESEYPLIRTRFTQGRFPERIIDGLKAILAEAQGNPLIVRSSSLLEDSFGTSFAGKYESHFCPNQGGPKENLEDLVTAITKIYASVKSPDVLLYRRKMGLIDYDERMAILIQEVYGESTGRHFLPDAAGVAFSRNQFRWSPRIQRDAGFLRMVWGLGTRAVEANAGDYPRLVALSHPELRPQSTPDKIRRYSQSRVDLIDLEANRYLSLPLEGVMGSQTRNLRWVAQHLQGGTLQDFVSRPLKLNPGEVVPTFNRLLCKSQFPALMREMLKTLETAYSTPVDVEFALRIGPNGTRRDDLQLSIGLLQCRPQSRLQSAQARLPQDLDEESRLFLVESVVPQGRVSDVRFLVYVRPAAFAGLPLGTKRNTLAKVIGQINHRLEDENFILMGPGRWGSSNTELGIPVTYGDIYNARALVEMFEDDFAPEPSYGTHFFQDLVEAKIYPLALAIDAEGDPFNLRFFDKAPNALLDLLPEADGWQETVKVIDVEAAKPGHRVELVMDGEIDTAVAYLRELAA